MEPRTFATAPGLAGMRLKIGVMGSATGELAGEAIAKAHAVGRSIARHGCVLITGACPGLPLAAARGAREEGGTVIGISPGLSLDEHVGKYSSPTESHDVLIFTGSGLMGREVVNIRSSDIVVIAGGASGTLGELAIAYDEGKLIGVLTGTGGVSDIAREILAACRKETGAHVLYCADPEELVAGLLEAYRTEHHRRPSCFCADAICAPPPHPRSAEAFTVRDPVCGMAVAHGTEAAERRFGGRAYVFCSTACAAKFDGDPDGFAGGTPPRPRTEPPMDRGLES